MGSKRRTHEPADPCTGLVISWYPWNDHTTAYLTKSWRTAEGRDSARLATYHLGVRRSDLVGHTIEDAMYLLMASVVLAMTSDHDPADRRALATGWGAAPPHPPSGGIIGGFPGSETLPGL